MMTMFFNLLRIGLVLVSSTFMVALFTKYWNTPLFASWWTPVLMTGALLVAISQVVYLFLAAKRDKKGWKTNYILNKTTAQATERAGVHNT